jgi:hypothetical protein
MTFHVKIDIIFIYLHTQRERENIHWGYPIGEFCLIAKINCSIENNNREKNNQTSGMKFIFSHQHKNFSFLHRFFFFSLHKQMTKTTTGTQRRRRRRRKAYCINKVMFNYIPMRFYRKPNKQK